MLTQLAKIFQTHQSKLSYGRLFLACSGGRDSLALAWACKCLYEQGDLPMLPILLHVHHGWQAVNDDWASLVDTWAKSHGFDCQILPIQLPKNSETIARDARYEALAGVMKSGDVLLLAHHADDQAETVLMRLVNGAGVAGLSAMKLWQHRQILGKDLRLFRPMLEISRKEISQFANHHALPYVDDVTNTSDAYVRGKLRNHVLPIFRQMNPQAVQNIARSSQLLHEASQIVSLLIDEKLALCRDDWSQGLFCQVLDIKQVMMLPEVVQSSLVHAWLSQGEALPPNQRLVQAVLTLMHRTTHDHQTQLFWQGEHGYVICRFGGRIYRYRMDAWACLSADTKMIGLACHQSVSPDGGVMLLKHTQDCAVVWQIAPELLKKQIRLLPVTRQTPIPFWLGGVLKNLHGKKLVQSLGVPVWLRDNLWLVVADGVPVLLLTVGRVWRLDRLDKNGEAMGAKFCVLGVDGVKWQSLSS